MMLFSKMNPEKEAALAKGGQSQLCAQSQTSSLFLQSSCPRLLHAEDLFLSSHMGMSQCVTFGVVLLLLLLGSVPTSLQICSVYGELITWETAT